MGTTAELKLPYPESNDAVSEGAANFRSLANAIEPTIKQRHYAGIVSGCTLPSPGGVLGFASGLSIPSMPYPQLGFVFISGLMTEIDANSGRIDLILRDASGSALMYAGISALGTCSMVFPLQLNVNQPSPSMQVVASGHDGCTWSSDPRWSKFFAIMGYGH